jgi:hypothetical protein
VENDIRVVDGTVGGNMAPDHNVKVDMDIVVAAEGKFEAHPEAYSPRVFVAIMPPTGNEDGDGVPETAVDKVYEILTNGWAIPWPCLPDKRTCGFDYWEVYSDCLPNMIRHNVPKAVRVPVVSDATWRAIREKEDFPVSGRVIYRPGRVI